MHRTSVRRGLAAALTLSVLTLGSACGSDDEPADTADPVQGESDAPEPPADEADEVDETDEVDLTDDVCTLVSAEEISAAIGREVTTSTGPVGDCEFTEEDPRGVSGAIGVIGDAATNGGYDGYVAGVTAVIPDAVTREIEGLGAAASTYAGVPDFGGTTQVAAGGVVDRGTFLEQVTLAQASDLTVADLDPMVEALLRLLDSKIA
jgi:hypothetical protein